MSGLLSVVLPACNHTGNSRSGTTADTSSSGQSAAPATAALPDTARFSITPAGKNIHLFILKNKGISAAITNYGGRLVSLLVPDKAGALHDVVLGYDRAETYQKPKEPYFGAIIGRYGNRIGKGQFSLSGKNYRLDLNDGSNSLHGGKEGFSGQIWTGIRTSDSTLELTYRSKDGEGGYPGTLTVKVVYTVTSGRGLQIAYSANSDKLTVLNLTNHAYFNLSGAGSKTILDHQVMINASTYTPVDTTLIPIGRLESVKGTPFDFTAGKAIGRDITTAGDQLKNGKGYDHNFVLDRPRSSTPAAKSILAATVSSPVTGIIMQVYTDQPGLQFYTGNFLTGKDHDGKNGASYPYRSAFCMETQHFPDSPNQPAFPSTELKPGQVYHSVSEYRFSNQ